MRMHSPEVGLWQVSCSDTELPVRVVGEEPRWATGCEDGQSFRGPVSSRPPPFFFVTESETEPENTRGELTKDKYSFIPDDVISFS